MENIIVTVRFKPNLKLNEATKHDPKSHLQDCWRIYKEPHNVVSNLRSKQNYIFDYVFAEDSNNQQIFNIVALPLIQSSFEGINSTIFAYGQTSSGKTYTIRGSPSEPGLVIQALSYIFDFTKTNSSSTRVKISYLEVYNEQINDLLDPSRTNLEIREHPERGIYVEKLSEFEVESENKALELLSMGEALRKTGETGMNAVSSRSHSVFKIHIETTNEYFYKSAQLNFVDLAGSEGMQKAKTEDLRLREGSNINKSLLSLSSVIQKLSDSKGNKGYINFRDSKMTRLLQPALSGNSRTAVICTVNPELSHYQESNNTLLFGIRAKHIKNDVKINQVIVNEQHIQDLSEENKKLVEKILELEKILDESSKEHFKNLEEHKKSGLELEQIVQRQVVQIEGLNLQVKNAENERIYWTEQKIKFEKVNEDNMKTIGEFFLKLSAAQDLIKDLECKLDILNKQNVNQQNYINCIAQELSESKDRVICQDKLLDDAKNRESEYLSQITICKELNQELEKRFEDKVEENLRSIRRVEELLNENQEFHERLEGFRVLLDQEVGNRRKIEAEINEIKAENCGLLEKLKSGYIEIEGLKVKIEENEVQNMFMKDKLQAAQVNIRIIEETRKESSQRLEVCLKNEDFLKSQVSSLEKTLASEKEKLMQLENSIQQLQTSIKTIDTEKSAIIQSLTLEINSKSELLAIKETTLASKLEEIQILTEKFQKPSEEITKTHQSLITKCSSLEAELNLALSKTLNLESQLSQHSSLLIEKENEIQSLTEITQYKTNLLKELQIQLKDCISKNNFLETTNLNLLSELETNKSKNKSFIVELNSYIDGHEQSEKSFSELRSELGLKNEKIETLLAEIMKLKSDIQQLQEELDIQINEKLLIEQENFKLEYMYDYKDNSITVQVDQDDVNQTFAQLVKEKVDNLEEFEKLKEQYFSEVRVCKELRETIEDYNEKIKQLKEENMKYAEELGNVKEKNKEITRNMNNKRISCGIIDENILQPIEANEKYKLKLAVASLQCELRSLSEEIQGLKKEKVQLRNEKEEIEKILEDLMAEKKQLKVKLDELEKKNAQYYNEIGYLIAEKEMKLYESSNDTMETKKVIAKKKEMRFLELGNSPKCRTQ